MKSSKWNSSRSGLTLRLSVVGVPTYMINPFVDLLCKWTLCSGDEWTVSRCKSLKLTLIQMRSKSVLTVPLAKNRKGQIRGVVGSMLRYALKSDKNFIKILNAFMAYTHWVSVSLTKIQKNKFLQAVNATPVFMPDSFVRSLVRTTKSYVRGRTIHGKPQSLIYWRGSSSKRAPTLNQGPVIQSEKLLWEVFLTDNIWTQNHIQTLWDIYKYVFNGIDVSGIFHKRNAMVADYDSLIAGEVHFLQEPGYKLRSIASPYRLFQVASQPLKDDLSQLVQGLEWDCTHDQAKAVPFIQKALMQKSKVYSVDLSSATDMFPYELQQIVLETIYGKDSPYIRLFRDVSRANWKSELGMISWKKGQPLGFNPSFFTFTLTHGLVLQTLLGRKYNSEFFVLGDDVIILDEVLFKRYTSFLNEAACPYSPDKTLISDELAEFAGKVITSDHVYPQLKWRSVSDDNFLDLARLIGPRIRFLLSKKQNQVLDVFSHVSNLVHPYGLNWSYEGSNLLKMIKAGLELCFKERVLDSLTGLSRHTNNQLYADYGIYANDLINFIDFDKIEKEVQTFDEKVKSVFSKLGFTRKFDSEYFLEGLKDIPLALLDGSKHPELPFAEMQPSRVSLLQRLSRSFLYKDKSPTT